MPDTATAPTGSIDGVPFYANGTAPRHLLTKTGLHEHRLTLAEGQQPAAYIRTKYWQDVVGLYDPASAVPLPPRTIGQDWAYRTRRTCPKCRARKPYVVDGEMCGECRTAEQRKAARRYARTCRACGKIGEHPFARDKQYPGWHRCPPCRALRKAELRAEFEAGLERAQRCPDCHQPVLSRSAALKAYWERAYWLRRVCDPCQAQRAERAELERREAVEAGQHRIQARRDQVRALEQWARDVLADPATVILDTETTGLHATARTVDLAVTTAGRETLIDTLVTPGEPIPAAATSIHGIIDAMVADAPRFTDITDQLARVLAGRRVIIYNVDFDAGILIYELGGDNTVRDRIGALKALLPAADYEDAMVPYSDWVGEEDDWHAGYRWQRLGGAHRALGDCLAVVDVLEAMAKGSSDEDEEPA
jgi:DNA polymerase III epsilon subunit-like protein